MIGVLLCNSANKLTELSSKHHCYISDSNMVLCSFVQYSKAKLVCGMRWTVSEVRWQLANWCRTTSAARGEAGRSGLAQWQLAPAPNLFLNHYHHDSFIKSAAKLPPPPPPTIHLSSTPPIHRSLQSVNYTSQLSAVDLVRDWPPAYQLRAPSQSRR